MLYVKLLTAAAIAVLSIGNSHAQEAEKIQDVVTEAVEALASETLGQAEKNSATSVALDNEGNLVGKAFVAADSKTPLEAKVTIANAEGVVVDTVVAGEDGAFAFANVAPGTYNMYGATSNYVGAQTYDVLPYSGSGCSSCDLGLSTYQEPVYETYASAPCSSCSAAPVSPCGCGGGGGGGFFGGGGGGLLGGGGGGGLFSSRLVRLGALGGVVAIATSSDDDDDASPDE